MQFEIPGDEKNVKELRRRAAFLGALCRMQTTCADVGCIRAALRPTAGPTAEPALTTRAVLLAASHFPLGGDPITVSFGTHATLTGSLNTVVIDAQRLSRAFAVEDGARLTLIDLTLVNGSEPDGDGGGISVVGPGSRLQLRSVNIVGCSAARGGGVYLKDAQAELNDTVIEDCHAEAECEAPGAGGLSCARHDGGGLAADRSTVQLNSCHVRSCSAADDGGGFTCIGHGVGSLTLRDTTVADCHAGDDGGAVQLHSCELTVHGSRLRGCSAADDGGGVYVHIKSSASVVASEISGCRALSHGGGLLLWKGSHLH